MTPLDEIWSIRWLVGSQRDARQTIILTKNRNRTARHRRRPCHSCDGVWRPVDLGQFLGSYSRRRPLGGSDCDRNWCPRLVVFRSPEDPFRRRKLWRRSKVGGIVILAISILLAAELVRLNLARIEAAPLFFFIFLSIILLLGCKILLEIALAVTKFFDPVTRSADEKHDRPLPRR
jgi:hypothetical protein